MKDFQKTLKELRELSTINEETKALLEKMTGKELVDYESIDALVGALMTHYNGELKKKATTSHSHTWLEVTSKPTTFPPSSHNHDERYYTEEEIDTKFKNYCPISVGSIDVRYDNKNPAELYPSTTWELLSSDKYIRTGTTPLNRDGSNSVTISKANLPNIKLKVDSFSLTTQPHTHNLHVMGCTNQGANIHQNAVHTDNEYHGQVDLRTDWNYAKSGGGANTGSASPSTESLGSGTALSIQPEYITLKFWKRLT